MAFLLPSFCLLLMVVVSFRLVTVFTMATHLLSFHTRQFTLPDLASLESPRSIFFVHFFVIGKGRRPFSPVSPCSAYAKRIFAKQ